MLQKILTVEQLESREKHKGGMGMSPNHPTAQIITERLADLISLGVFVCISLLIFVYIYLLFIQD